MSGVPPPPLGVAAAGSPAPVQSTNKRRRGMPPPLSSASAAAASDKRTRKPVIKYEPDTQFPDKSKEAAEAARKRAEGSREVQETLALRALRRMVPEVKVLDGVTGLRQGEEAVVRTGTQGPPPDLCKFVIESWCGSGSKALFKPPADPSWKEKAFRQIPFKVIEDNETAKPALDKIREWLAATWLEGGAWVVVDFYAVPRVNDTSPFHQDQIKGWWTHARDGYRVIADFGNLPSMDGDRWMEFETRGGGRRKQVFVTHAPMIAMNGAAAGSGRATNVWHARWGPGLTIVIDVVMLKEGGAAAPGVGNVSKHNPGVYQFFRPIGGTSASASAPAAPRKHGGPTAVEAAAARAAAAADAGGTANDIPHCFWCGSKDKGAEGASWRYDDHNCRYCMACFGSFVRSWALEAVRPSSCRGCPGCVLEAGASTRPTAEGNAAKRAAAAAAAAPAAAPAPAPEVGPQYHCWWCDGGAGRSYWAYRTSKRLCKNCHRARLDEGAGGAPRPSRCGGCEGCLVVYSGGRWWPRSAA